MSNVPAPPLDTNALLAALLAGVTQQQQPRPQPPPRPRPAPPVQATTQTIAQAYMADLTAKDQLLTYRNGAWYRWNGTIYERITDPDDEILTHCQAFITEWWNRAGRPKLNITPQVVSAVSTFAGRALPKPQAPPDLHLTFANGAVDLSKGFMADGSGVPNAALSSPSPNFFTTNTFPVRFDPLAPEPERWLRFLNETFEEDQEIIGFLQRWIGHLLLPDNSQQKIVFFHGEPRAGKGTIVRTIEALLGEANVSAIPSNGFAGRFDLHIMVNKLLNVSPEASSMSKGDVEMVKAISGRDKLKIERKYRDAEEHRFFTRLLLQTNDLPDFDDLSGAMDARLIIIPFNKRVSKADPLLEPTIQGPELPGILNWALQGLQLYWMDKEAGRDPLPLPSASVKRVAQHSLETNPARQFLRFEVTKDDTAEVTTEELQSAYIQWCKANGIAARKLLDAVGLGREVKRHLGVSSELRKLSGRVQRVYKGLSLPPATANEWPSSPGW